MERTAVVAIIKDELEYLPEWLSWHRLAGFDRFLLADNGSGDGTREYLEALEDAGLADVLYQHKTPNAQTSAYGRLIHTFGSDYRYLAIIDADEFLTTEGTRSVRDTVDDIFSRRPDCGAIAVNWRLFGSSGQDQQLDGLVYERFTGCAGDAHEKNLYFKTIATPAAIQSAKIHQCQLREPYRYYNCRGEQINFKNRQGVAVSRPTGMTSALCEGPLRVNHYIVKSRQEYEQKKRRKGDAVLGPHHDRTMQYFHDNDLNEARLETDAGIIAKLHSAMQDLENLLAGNSRYDIPHRGELSNCNSKFLEGWCDAADGVEPVMVVSVNGDVVGTTRALEEGTGNSSHPEYKGRFSFRFDSPLSGEDTVAVTIRGNRHRIAHHVQKPALA
jgi:hypothetical protein